MPFNLGMTELLVILMLLLLVFGAKRLPEIGSSMGKSIREFKKSIKDVQESIDEPSPSGGSPRQIDSAPTNNRDGEPKKLSE